MERFKTMKKSTELMQLSETKIFIIKIILFLGQKTFLGRGKIRKIIIDFINFFIGIGNIDNSRFVCKVNEIPLHFYNDKLTGIKVYFGRNENKEINFIKSKSLNNSVFIDIGSNMGLFTLNVASLYSNNNKVKIIAIDANPINNLRLKRNLKLLKKKISKIFSIVRIKNCALGDRNKKIYFDFTPGLANGRIIKKKSKKNIVVNCRKLIDIVKEEKLNYITNLKIDIEGYEDRVLLSFLKNCKKNLYPKNIILEHASNHLWKYDLVKYLYNLGYIKVFKNNANIVMSLK